MLLIFGGLLLWLVERVRAGRNWARWTLSLCLALSWISGFTEFQEGFTLSPLFATIDAACSLLELVACVMLFVGQGAKWFKTP